MRIIAQGLVLLALATAVPVAVSLAADTDKPVADKPAETAQGKIVAATPKHAARPGEAWKEKGRIVGKVSQAPAFKVEVLDADGKVALSKDVSAGAKAYEMEWLSPGTYTLKISAEGYGALEVKDLEVKARNDLVVGLEFDK